MLADLYRYKASSPFWVLGALLSPGLQALLVYRFGNWRRSQSLPVRILLSPFYLPLAWLVRLCWGIEILSTAKIGPGCFIYHSGGIVIGGEVIIGKHATLHHDVTIGNHRGKCPTIGDNVVIYPGAKIFGDIKIGNNVVIGANAVVHQDIPDGSVAALVPGFSILPRATA